MSVAVSLIIDDGAPINPMYFLRPWEESEFLIPNDFVRRFDKVVRRYGIKGKYSVMPMPSMLGRIDQKLSYVPQAHLKEFLKIVRERIMQNFDITPEILTHQNAYDLKSGTYGNIREDDWVAHASVEEMTEYFVLANQILKNVGIIPNGMTSPWSTGNTNESDYACAIGNAQWAVFKRKFVWYFLHWSFDKTPKVAWVTHRNQNRGQMVVTLAGNCPDAFWAWAGIQSKRQQVAAVKKGVDGLLSRDGKTGRIRELADQGLPCILVTHWQALFTNGTGLGLDGLEECAARIRNVFGSEVHWSRCSDVARTWGPRDGEK